MTVPNIGDILMLSQKAWKIGRTFAACQKDAPAELRYIEVEIGGLAKALKRLAEELHTEPEQDLLRNSDQRTQNGIDTVLDFCQRTVNDLDSLVDQYQVIKKHRTIGGFAIERAWSDLVLSEYKTIIWTTEGGNLTDLRDLLQTHTSSVTALIQAPQSKSSTRLKGVVKPMAERIDSMYHSTGTVDEHLEEVHRMVQGLAITSHDASAPPVPARNPARSPAGDLPDQQSQSPDPSYLSKSPSRHRDYNFSLPRIPQHLGSSEHSATADSNKDTPSPSSPTETVSSSKASVTGKRASGMSLEGSSLRYSSSSYASSDAGQSSAGWQSPQPVGNHHYLNRQQSTSTKKASPLPGTPEIREPEQSADSRHLSRLPPPAMGIANPNELERPPTHTSSTARLSPYPASQPGIMKLHRSSTTASQRAAFEKEAFRNSAILCDVRGKTVEYSHRINQDDPRDVEMIQAADECRITVVRKRVTDPETRTVRVVTSVWAFSDDNTTRVELRMEDDQMYIPYASYFSPTKVSITVPCELKFHDVKHGSRPARTAKTSWVNYVFDTPQAAALFQNEIMGRTLLATFRTEKTMRIHEGLSRSFSYAEQMCGLENLRVWEDNDTGAIIALIHFSASFRNGYLAFYLNSVVNPIKVKDDGGRDIKIKGLRVPVDSGDRAMRKDSMADAAAGKGKGKASVDKEKVISGAKIEFASDAEKREFLDLCREMQRELMELPDLLGVN